MQAIKNLSIRNKLLVGVGVVFAAMALLSFTTYRMTGASQERVADVNHTYDELLLVEETFNGLLEMESAYRGYLLTGKESYLEAFDHGRHEAHDHLAELEEASADDPEALAQWTDIGQRISAWEAEVTTPGIELRQAVNAGTADMQEVLDFEATGLDSEHTDAIHANLVSGIDHEKELLAEAIHDEHEATNFLRSTVIWGTVAALLAGLAAVFVLARLLTGPIHSLLATMRDAFSGEMDLTQRVEVAGADEIGQIGDCVNEFVAKLEDTVALIGQNSGHLSDSAEDLDSVSDSMAAAAGQASNQAVQVSDASERVSNSVSAVSAASEEMRASIQEISTQSTSAAAMVAKAVVAAEEASTTIARLGERSEEIGAVIAMITSIAEQTNLLALNATIESARAGEAGKGFAVVANEVKELATQTADATEEISSRIDATQADTRVAVESIGQISHIIDEINGMFTAIAGAIEEQNVTAAEMSSQFSEVANDSGDIAHSISSVTEAAGAASDAAATTRTSAQLLNGMSAELLRLVSQFRYASGASTSVPVAPTADADIDDASESEDELAYA